MIRGRGQITHTRLNGLVVYRGRLLLDHATLTASGNVKSFYLAEPPEKTELARLLALAAETAAVEAPVFSLEKLPDIDWVAESQRALPAITAGRFRLRGSHITAPAPWGAIDLLIDANAAFGTGRHETTRGCLLAMQALSKRHAAKRRAVERVLDMGCGSGVLAMAAAKLWPCRVLAVDNDAPSIEVAQQNLRNNGVADCVQLLLSDGFRRAAVAGPYDLILANILAEPLCRMAQDLSRHLAPGGVAILSGLLVGQEQAVIARYRIADLRLVHRFHLEEWSTLVLQASRTRTRDSNGGASLV